MNVMNTRPPNTATRQHGSTAAQQHGVTATRQHRSTLIILVLIFIVLGGMAKAYYDTNTIEVRHYEITSGSLGEALAGLKVAFLADLHVKKVDVRENKTLEILRRERPDVILLGGDLIGFKSQYAPLTSFLSRLEAPHGIYAVLGNTEYSNENGSCILCHKEKSRSLRQGTHPVFIRNSSVLVKVNGKAVNIAGLDDPVRGKADIDETLRTVDPNYPTIFLSHSPAMFDEASTREVDLILSGHTHGGQLFITRYLRKIFPFDPALEFLEGFFQKGRAPMYVSRGLGTSYLPFRFGVQPEITFFTFTGSQRYASLGKELSVSNNPPRTLFSGINLSSIIETFDIFGSRGDSSWVKRPTDAIDSMNPIDSGNSRILIDFESEGELQQLNWECHKWFELSKENVTSGNYSLKVTLPAGQYPGIVFENLRTDWSESKFLRMDVFNCSPEEVKFHIRIDDHKSGWEYANRFDINFALNPGMNNISVPTDTIRTNIHSRRLNLKKIEDMMVWIPNNERTRELYIDNVRLE
jgi:hypothetical protein